MIRPMIKNRPNRASSIIFAMMVMVMIINDDD